VNTISQYIPFQLSLFLVLGVLVGFYFPLPLQNLLISGLVALLVLSVFYYINKTNYRWRGVFQLLSYTLIFIIGNLAISLKNPVNIKTHYSHFITENNTVVFQINKQLKPTLYHTKYFATILQIDSKKSIGKVLVNISKDSTNKILEVGKTYLTYSKLAEINKPKNPYSFDYNAYLNKQSVLHQISTKKELIKPIENDNFSLQISAAKIRRKIQKSLLKHNFTKNELGIINALVLGQRQSISKELLSSYAGAGAIHILAVSGLHVGILFMLLGFLLKPIEKIKHGKHFNTIFIISFLWGFALLTGLSGSVVRAVTMFTFIAIGMAVTNNRSSVLHALVTSFFLLVLIHPLFVFDVGFQMSYAAVLGIVLLFPKIESLLPRIKWVFPRKIWQLFVVSLSATIGTLPISLYYFHQFPGLFFLSNIVIVPFDGLIMGIGILVILLSLINQLPDFLVDIYGFILSLMNGFIEWVALQEQFLFQNISFSIFALFASYLVIALGYRWWLSIIPKRLITFLIAILVFQGILFMEKCQTEKSSELIVFHKSRNTLIGIKQKNQLQIFHSLDSLIPTKMRFVDNYSIGNRLEKSTYKKLKTNIIEYKETTMLLVDSLGIYKDLSFKPDIVLLRLSPKINLDRLLKSTKTKLVLADGSNYKSSVYKWKETCLLNNIDFYYTGTKGAFVLKK